MDKHHPDKTGKQVRRCTHDSPDVECKATISFKACAGGWKGAPEVRDHLKAKLVVGRGGAYSGHAVTMGAMRSTAQQTSPRVVHYHHRPLPCKAPRFSFVDDFSEAFDEESEEGRLRLPTTTTDCVIRTAISPPPPPRGGPTPPPPPPPPPGVSPAPHTLARWQSSGRRLRPCA